MFHIDEIAVNQRMEDIRSDVEASRMRSRRKTGKAERSNPIWLVLTTLFHK